MPGMTPVIEDPPIAHPARHLNALMGSFLYRGCRASVC